MNKKGGLILNVVACLIDTNRIRVESAKRMAEALKRNAVQQRLQRCNFVRMLLVLGRDLLNDDGAPSYWKRMPAEIRKLLLEHVCEVWPAMGKTKKQARQCAHFLMQIENIKSVNKLLSGSANGFRAVEKAASSRFEIRHAAVNDRSQCNLV